MFESIASAGPVPLLIPCPFLVLPKFPIVPHGSGPQFS